MQCNASFIYCKKKTTKIKVLTAARCRPDHVRSPGARLRWRRRHAAGDGPVAPHRGGEVHHRGRHAETADGGEQGDTISQGLEKSAYTNLFAMFMFTFTGKTTGGDKP